MVHVRSERSQQRTLALLRPKTDVSLAERFRQLFDAHIVICDASELGLSRSQSLSRPRSSNATPSPSQAAARLSS